MAAYITSAGVYYEGSRNGADEEVPKRPTPDYDWVPSPNGISGDWVLNKERRTQAIMVQIDDLERASLMNRGTRELQLRLMEREAETMVRAQYPDADDAAVQAAVIQTLQSVTAYTRFKELDDQITQLRGEIWLLSESTPG